MALGTREILLIIRARDQASRVLADIGRGIGQVDDHTAALARQNIQLGQALTGIGIGFAAAGAAGLAFYGSATRVVPSC